MPCEKLLIFIFSLKCYAYRDIGDRFQHSISTIVAVIHEVCNAVLVSPRNNFFPALSLSTHSRIAEDVKFELFNDCIGALDGTHIPCVVSPETSKPYRNRKDFTSQNVLGVCNFDGVFTFVHVGWEGSAHDSRVLNDAIIHGSPLPQGKYYPLTLITLCLNIV